MEALLELTRYMADRLNEKQLPADGDPAFEQRIDEVGGGRLRQLLDFCGDGSDVADPWYTGDFDVTWQDVQRGCRAMMKQIEKELKKE